MFFFGSRSPQPFGLKQNCQEEATSGAKGPTVPAALRGLDAPELEIKIGQMVQGGHGFCGPENRRNILNGVVSYHQHHQNICNLVAKKPMFSCDVTQVMVEYRDIESFLLSIENGQGVPK